MNRGGAVLLLKGLLVALAAFGGSLAVLWPLPLHLGDAFVEELDSHLNAWILVWGYRHLASGLPALFDANIFHPIRNTFTLSENMLGNQVVFAPLYAATHDPAWAYNAMVVVSFVLCCLAVAWIVWDRTHSAFAAAAGGLAFGLSPMRISQLAHVQLLEIYWLPIGIWSLDRYVAGRKRRWAWLAAGMLALQFWTSIYLGYIALLGYLVFLAGHVWADRSLLRDLRSWRALLVAHVAAGLATLPALLPYALFHRLWEVHSTLGDKMVKSAELTSYFTVNGYNRLYSRWIHTLADSPHFPWEKNLFFGIVPMVLGGWFLWKERRNPGLKPWLALAVGGYILSLGPVLMLWGVNTHIPLPYFLFDKLIPGLAAIRVPSRVGFLVLLAFCVAAGLAFHLLWQRGLAVRVLAAGLAAFGFAETLNWPLPMYRHYEIDRPEIAFLAGTPDRKPILELPMAQLYAYPQMVQESKRMYGSLYHRHPLVGGYSGYYPPTYTQLAELANSGPSADLRDVLGALEVGYLVIHFDEAGERAPAWLAQATQAGLAPAMTASSSVVYRIAPLPTSPATTALVFPPDLAAGRTTLATVSLGNYPGKVWVHEQPQGKAAIAFTWQPLGGGAQPHRQTLRAQIPLFGCFSKPGLISVDVRLPTAPGKYLVEAKGPDFSATASVMVADAS